jgi:hypothetical protein
VDEYGFPYWRPTGRTQPQPIEPVPTDDQKIARAEKKRAARERAKAKAAKAAEEARETPEERSRRLTRLAEEEAARNEWFDMAFRASRKCGKAKFAVMQANLTRFDPPADAAESAVYVNAAFDRIKEEELARWLNKEEAVDRVVPVIEAFGRAEAAAFVRKRSKDAVDWGEYVGKAIERAQAETAQAEAAQADAAQAEAAQAEAAQAEAAGHERAELGESERVCECAKNKPADGQTEDSADWAEECRRVAHEVVCNFVCKAFPDVYAEGQPGP